MIPRAVKQIFNTAREGGEMKCVFPPNFRALCGPHTSRPNLPRTCARHHLQTAPVSTFGCSHPSRALQIHAQSGIRRDLQREREGFAGQGKCCGGWGRRQRRFTAFFCFLLNLHILLLLLFSQPAAQDKEASLDIKHERGTQRVYVLTPFSTAFL